MLVSKYHCDPRPEEFSTVLRTDSSGAVDLGCLENVKYVYSMVKENFGNNIKADARKWILLEDTTLDYQSEIVLVESETIELPVLPESSVSLY